MNIYDTLKYHRVSRGLSQSTIAKDTGISQPKLSYFESGKHLPMIDDCIKLADFYDISLDELVGREYNKQTK